MKSETDKDIFECGCCLFWRDPKCTTHTPHFVIVDVDKDGSETVSYEPKNYKPEK